jgi:hypothetical protein
MYEVQARHADGWHSVDWRDTSEAAYGAAAVYRHGANARIEVRILRDVDGVRVLVAHWRGRRGPGGIAA